MRGANIPGCEVSVELVRSVALQKNKARLRPVVEPVLLGDVEGVKLVLGEMGRRGL